MDYDKATTKTEKNLLQTCYHPQNGRNTPRRWSQLAYAGERRVPPSEEPTAAYWATFYLRRNDRGQFIDSEGNPLAFSIRYPDMSIDFEDEQLTLVKKTLENITPEQIQIAKYWGEGPATKQWTPIIDRLIDTYKITAPRAARILAATQAAMNDALIVAWHFKFLWEVPRPNQLDQNLATLLCTPNHPSYPSGHATIAGCTQVVLSYFFKPEADRLKELAEECAISRLYAGVHYPIDNDEGLRLGRQIGEFIVGLLASQYGKDGNQIDHVITVNHHANLMPPPFRQVIPYEKEPSCKSKIRPTYEEIEFENRNI